MSRVLLLLLMRGGVVCLCARACVVIVGGEEKGRVGLSVVGVWERLKVDGGVDEKEG